MHARYSSCSVVCRRLWSTDAAFFFQDSFLKSLPATPHGLRIVELVFGGEAVEKRFLAYARSGF